MTICKIMQNSKIHIIIIPIIVFIITCAIMIMFISLIII